MTVFSPGLHHVTAIAGDARRNHDFYTKALRQRMVKKTVNFDDPGTYHLYYADRSGTPGSVVTFFPWAQAARGHGGSGETGETAYAVAPEALDAEVARLREAGVAATPAGERFGAAAATFQDPDGMALALVATPGAGAGLPGFHGVTLDLADIEPTRAVMEHVLGWRESGREGQGASLRVRMSAPDGSGALGQHVDLAVRAAARGRFGAGSVHHIAFRAAGDAQQAEMARRLAAMGLAATPQQDRQYFRSIYFREPGGVLFEIATDPPGFAVDEAPDALGTALMLPPQHEHMRAKLEKSLPPLG